MRMYLLDLPPELLGEILDIIALDYGLTRSMELRRLCRFFADEIIEAVCRTGVIESFWGRWNGTSLRQIKPTDSAWNRLLIPTFLRWKVQHDTRGNHSIINTLRCTADRLAEKGHNRSETVKRLCEAVSVLWGIDLISHELEFFQEPRSAPPANQEQGSAIDLVVAAAILGDYEIVRQAEIDLLPVRSVYFGSVLTAVCTRGDLPMVKYLLQHHPIAKYICSISRQHYPPGVSLRYASQNGVRYPLNAAVYGGHLELLKKVCPDQSNRMFRMDIASVLPSAAASGKIAVMQFLLEMLSKSLGISVSKVLNDDIELCINPTRRPLGKILTTRAVMYGHKHLVQHLINHGAKKALFKDNAVFGALLLRIAAAQGDKNMTKMLLKNGISPNKKDSRGKTPLRTAVSLGWTDIEEILVEHGAVVSGDIMPDPIVWAAAQGDATLVRFLLQNGAVLNNASSNMAHFVYFMAYKKTLNPAMIRMLRENGLRIMDMDQIKDFLKTYPWKWKELFTLVPMLFEILDSQGTHITPRGFMSSL